MSSIADVAVVGGGVAGLFAALRLAARGVRPIVFESRSRVGGLLVTERFGDADLELFYHHAFVDDDFLLDTFRELGIDVTWTVTRTGFVGPSLEGVAEFSAPQHVLTFPYLSPMMRLRLSATLVRAAAEWRLRGFRVADWDRLTAREWVCSWGGGRSVWDEFLGPLLEKKFGSTTPEISAAFLMGRLGMRSGRTARGEKLAYPRGGFRKLVDGLAARVTELGGVIHTETSALAITTTQGRVTGLAASNGHHPVDAVVATASPRAITRMFDASGFDDEARAMERLPYQGVLTMLAGLTRPTGPFYWINVMHRDSPYGAIIDHSNLVPSEPYGGPIIYATAYPDDDSELLRMDDDQVSEEFLLHLRRQIPSLVNNPVRWTRIVRTDEASLVYRCGVRDLLPPRRARTVTGLYYAGMYRCYPLRKIDLVGSDACATADLVARDLAAGCPTHEPASLPQRLIPVAGR